MWAMRQPLKLIHKSQGVKTIGNISKMINTTYMEIPMYDFNKPQSLEKRKARLHYQSRKRGMLENDLLLSTFAKKYLDSFTEEQVLLYDKLINSVSNDWDLFHWIVEKAPTPQEFDNEIMDLLKRHVIILCYIGDRHPLQ